MTRFILLLPLLLSACIETHPARVVTPYGNYGYSCPPEYELYGLCRAVHRPHNKHNPHNR